jgi:hypothetical protein
MISLTMMNAEELDISQLPAKFPVLKVSSRADLTEVK